MSSVIRAAAYIRYREDAKRRRGRLKCTPPNRVCGSRCIPPNWDCRLKGEGDDPHLKAAGKGIDVTAGAANIERGIKRVGKGLIKLSPSEIEGGRRAISRGAKKLAPGNIADKQKVEKRVYRLLGAVGAPLTVGVLGILAHNALKGADDRSGGGFPYRTVVGNKIDNSAASAVANIRRNMPLGFGERYRATEAAYGRAMEQTSRVMRGVSGVPEVPLAGTPGTNYLRKRSREGTVFAKAVLRHQDSLESIGRSYSKTDYDKWVKDSRFNFWTTPRSLEGGGNLPGVNAGGSVFSVPAANDLLAKSFGIPNAKATDTMEAHRGMINKIAAELDSTAEIVHQSMRQRGLDPSKPNDVRNFLRVNNPRNTGNTEIDTRTRGFVEELVVTHKKGGESSRVAARKLYNETVAGFDVYFRSIAEKTNETPGMKSQAQRSSFFTQASRAHAAFLGKAEGVARPVVGPGTEAAALRIYHARKVMGLKTAQITDVEMFNALSELFPTREIPRIPDQQLEMLNEAYKGTKGFNAFQRAQRPNYGPYGRRKRGDEATPNDLLISSKLGDRQDKKCGKSGIAEGKKCHKQSAGGAATPAKPTGGAVAEAPKPAPLVAGRAAKLAKIAAVAGVAAAGAAGAASAVSNRQQNAAYRSSPEQLNKLINKMSQENVTEAINKLPKKFQEPANNLLGKAKLGLAAVAADAQGMKIQSVDKKNNFSTWKHPAGHVMSIGSVGDTLVSFVSQKTGDVGGFPNYGMAFQTDLKFDQKAGVSRSNGVKIARTAEAMFQDQLSQLPDSTFIHAKAHADDGLGKKRASIYTKKGFRELPGVRGGNLYALKNEGTFTKIPDEQVERIAEMFRGKRSDAYGKAYEAARERLDKKCGKSGIAPGKKCHKHTSSSAPQPTGPNRTATLAKVAVGAGVVAGGALLLKQYAFSPQDQADFKEAIRVDIKVEESIAGLKAIGKGVDGEVYISRDKKHVYKKAHNPENTTPEVQKHLEAQQTGIKTARITAYDSERGIIKMEALPNHKPMNKQPGLSQAARTKAGIELFDNIYKLHEKGIMHGDLHARNMLVDRKGDVRVIDFAHNYKLADLPRGQRLGHRRGELSSVIDLADSMGYISKETHKAAIGLSADIRLKKIRPEEGFAQILELIRKGQAPAKYTTGGPDSVEVIRDAVDGNH